MDYFSGKNTNLRQFVSDMSPSFLKNKRSSGNVPGYDFFKPSTSSSNNWFSGNGSSNKGWFSSNSSSSGSSGVLSNILMIVLIIAILFFLFRTMSSSTSSSSDKKHKKSDDASSTSTASSSTSGWWSLFYIVILVMMIAGVMNGNFGTVGSVVIFLIILAIFYVIYAYVFSTNSKLTSGVNDATKSQAIIVPTGSSTSNFTYSIWIFVDDWSYNYGQIKPIFTRGSDIPSLDVSLGETENDLIIKQLVFNSVASNDGNSSIQTIIVPNIPIQKWVNITLSVYGRTFDTYIDGKLVKTTLLKGPANVTNGTDMMLSPMGGFSGYTSKFQYWSDSIDPVTAWTIYTQGYSDNALFSNPYEVKVSVLDNNQVTGSFKI